MITDRMRINHADTDDIPDYGSLFLRNFDEKTHVNDYCGSDDSDVDKLDLITNAAVGSTCLFISGDIYIRTIDGWAKFGEEAETETASSNSSPASLNLSPLDINRDSLTNEIDLSATENIPEELTVEPIMVDGELI